VWSRTVGMTSQVCSKLKSNMAVALIKQRIVPVDDDDDHHHADGVRLRL
jgi:hypothetical protein